MAMNIDEVREEAKSMNRFLKIADGETVKGTFDGSFERVDKEFKGQPSVKYETGFTFYPDGETKIYSGSARFFEECYERAQNRGISFESAVFSILRKGVGLETKYIIDIIDLPASEKTPF